MRPVSSGKTQGSHCTRTHRRYLGSDCARTHHRYLEFHVLMRATPASFCRTSKRGILPFLEPLTMEERSPAVRSLAGEGRVSRRGDPRKPAGGDKNLEASLDA